ASATTLYNLEGRVARRVDGMQRQSSILSLSDPVFDAVQPSVAQAGEVRTARSEPNFDSPLIRGGFLAAGGTLARLPGTAAETQAIRKAFAALAPDEVVVLQG